MLTHTITLRLEHTLGYVVFLTTCYGFEIPILSHALECRRHTQTPAHAYSLALALRLKHTSTRRDTHIQRHTHILRDTLMLGHSLSLSCLYSHTHTHTRTHSYLYSFRHSQTVTYPCSYLHTRMPMLAHVQTCTLDHILFLTTFYSLKILISFTHSNSDVRHTHINAYLFSLTQTNIRSYLHTIILRLTF